MGKKLSKTDLFSKYSNFLTPNDESGWKKNGSFTNAINNSTLSLHISAHENSDEAASFNSYYKNDEDKKKEKSGSIKKQEITNQTSTLLLQNPFEFSRQQNDKINGRR
jgi:hypothetical protein